MRLGGDGDRHRAFQLPVTQLKAPRGTGVAMVGIRASLPADTGVDDGCACRLDGLCQQLLPAAYCRR